MLCLTITSTKEIFTVEKDNKEDNSIAIYTVLSILIKMKNTLGLEATLEYVEKYLHTIEKHNPQVKDAVSHAVQLISVEKIYKEAMHCEKEWFSIPTDHYYFNFHEPWIKKSNPADPFSR